MVDDKFTPHPNPTQSESGYTDAVPLTFMVMARFPRSTISL